MVSAWRCPVHLSGGYVARVLVIIKDTHNIQKIDCPTPLRHQAIKSIQSCIRDRFTANGLALMSRRAVAGKSIGCGRGEVVVIGLEFCACPGSRPGSRSHTNAFGFVPASLRTTRAYEMRSYHPGGPTRLSGHTANRGARIRPAADTPVTRCIRLCCVNVRSPRSGWRCGQETAPYAKMEWKSVFALDIITQ